jgi:hypothetical protein
MKTTMKSAIKSLVHLFTGCFLLGILEDSVVAQPTNIQIKREWGKPVAGQFSISIVATKNHYVIGEPVDLQTAIKNVGTNSIVIGSMHPFQNFDSSVTFENKLIPLSQHGKQLIGHFKMTGGSASGDTLKPGEILTDNVNFPLTEIYDLKPTGVYQVSLTRELWSGTNTGWVKVTSNVIDITVVPSSSK